MFAFATDIHGEGRDTVLDNLQHRAGVDAITLAAVYHDARDVFPHNPLRRVRFMEPGAAYFRPDPALYEDLAIQPRVSRLVEEIDVFSDVIPAARERGMAVHAWTVYLHTDWVRDGSPEHAESNAFGDPKLTELCPANPAVREYVRTLTTDIARQGVQTIVAESLHYHPLEHGYHHERYFLALGAGTRFLLGLCFCQHCLAAASAGGCDAAGVQRFARDEIQRVFDGGEDSSAALGEIRGAWPRRRRAGRPPGRAGRAGREPRRRGDGDRRGRRRAVHVHGRVGRDQGLRRRHADRRPGSGDRLASRSRRLRGRPSLPRDRGDRLRGRAPSGSRLDLDAYRACLPAGGRLAAAMRPDAPRLRLRGQPRREAPDRAGARSRARRPLPLRLRCRSAPSTGSARLSKHPRRRGRI